MIPRRFAATVALCFLFGCDSRVVVGVDGGGQHDADVPSDTSTTADLPCYCDEGLVWLGGQCVPTSRLHTCVTTCDPRTAPCPDHQVCDNRAASPSCLANSVRPACVPQPSMGFGPGVLRIHPAFGPPGEIVKLTIEGGNFYVGALHFQAQLGEHGPLVNLAGTMMCQIRGYFQPPGAGVFPLLVYYGGPEARASLAGFYYARDEPIDTVQPGFPCSVGDICASAPPYDCACVEGRCRCEGP